MIIRLSQPVSIAAAAEDDAPTQSRTIEGLALPWDTIADASTGPVMFLAGALPVDGPAPKLLRDHDPTQPIGLVTHRENTPEGMRFRARLSETQAASDALTLAADGVLDSVSVGVEPTEFVWEGDTMVVAAGLWRELSLLPFGAFDAAKVDSVTMSAPIPTDDAAISETDEQATESPTPTPEPLEENHPMTTPTELTQPTSPLLVAASPRRITPAEYISAMVTGGGSPAVRAAIAEQGTADTPGIMPEPLVGAVFSDLAGRRPLIDALGTLAMPAGGTTFHRRTITQHVSVGEQAAEFDELASQKMTIGRIQVDKATYGGAVSLSNQEISWGDPDSVQLVWNDFRRVYAKQTETAVCAALATAASVTDSIADWTDGDELLDAFYDASVTISTAVDEMPTHLFVSAQRWADLGKAKTANGDRLFPNVGPTNAAGTMNPGAFTIGSFPFTVVVSPRFASGVAILGNPVGFEVYEQLVGQLSADQPTSLSVELAWYGFLATATIDSGAFVKFV